MILVLFHHKKNRIFRHDKRRGGGANKKRPDTYCIGALKLAATYSPTLCAVPSA